MSGSPDPSNSIGSAAHEPDLTEVLHRVRTCRICVERPAGVPLPHEPRPILRVSGSVRLLIASQAPGVRAHLSGVPFRDASGVRLRAWMDLDETSFYDESRLAIVPMGFCFPGHDRLKGDLPPRPECRATWHGRIFASLPQVETILAIGLYGIRYHAERLHRRRPAGLDEAVRAWRDYGEGPAPRIIPLPHPSWRNNAWLKRNPWFEDDVLPDLRREVKRLMASGSTFRSGSSRPG